MKMRSLVRRGSALLIVLSTVVLATVLVVATVTAMRMERSASFYNLERTRADFIARQGVDTGIALLLQATATNRFWVSGPGYIVASDTNTFGAPTNVIVLSSGYTTNTNTDISTDLNRKAIASTDRLLDPSGTNFPFAWIYVQKDGIYSASRNTNSVGRFAFWVDDESTRVNLNTANEPSTPWTADPSQISLGMLPGMAPWASAVAASATGRPLTTPFEVLGRNPTWMNALTSNRFYLTHYNQDPDVNPWGEPRLVLTTQATNALNRQFLQILKAPNTDPGTLANIDSNSLLNTMVKIIVPLSRTNWPYANGGSFNTKFGTNGRAVSQLTLDIVEYVRAAESVSVWIEPIIYSDAGVLSGSEAPSSIPVGARIGTTRRPMLSQIGVFCSTNTNSTSTGFLGTLHVETWLPPIYNAGTNSFNGWVLFAQIASSSGSSTNIAFTSLPTVVYTDGYARSTLTNIEIPANVTMGAPTNVQVRVALLKDHLLRTASILDIAPLVQGEFIDFPITTNTTSHRAINDPRVNKSANDWMAALGTITGDNPMDLSAENYSAYTGIPPSDGSTNSFYMPPPGSGVSSIGELGFVPTGISSEPHAPWRSLRLQTNSSSATNIPPDWALLDLFSAPVDSRFVPGTNAVAGRINLNALLRNSTTMARTNVLNALFSAPAYSAAISNTINVGLASGGMNFGSATNFTNLVSVGQLSEIAGIGDQGEAGEAIIRRMASLASVRSDVFSIYSCGQAISQANGKVTVNGEKIFRAMVERYFDANGAAQYRTIYWSEIYP